jgi:hypothetical protein
MHRREEMSSGQDDPKLAPHKFVLLYAGMFAPQPVWTVLNGMDIASTITHFESSMPINELAIHIAHVVSRREIRALYEVFRMAYRTAFIDDDDHDSVDPFNKAIQKIRRSDKSDLDENGKNDKAIWEALTLLLDRLRCPCKTTITEKIIGEPLGSWDTRPPVEIQAMDYWDSYTTLAQSGIIPRNLQYQSREHIFYVLFRHADNLSDDDPEMVVRRLRAADIEGVYNMLSLYGFDFKNPIIAILHIPACAIFPNDPTKTAAQNIVDYVVERMELDEHRAIEMWTEAEKTRRSDIIRAQDNIHRPNVPFGETIKKYVEENNLAHSNIVSRVASSTIDNYLTKSSLYFMGLESGIVNVKQCSCCARFTYDQDGLDLWRKFENHTWSVQDAFTDVPKGYFEMANGLTQNRIWPV